MKRQRTIVSTLALLAGICAAAPAAALAGPPLLSGYGGPGAGAQTIVGAALVNGPGGGSSGGSGRLGGRLRDRQRLRGRLGRPTGSGSAHGGSAGAGSEPAGSGGAESCSAELALRIGDLGNWPAARGVAAAPRRPRLPAPARTRAPQARIPLHRTLGRPRLLVPTTPGPRGSPARTCWHSCWRPACSPSWRWRQCD